MRTLLTVFALALLLTWSEAHAQSDAPAKQPPSPASKAVGSRALGQHPPDLQAHMHSWYEDCRKGWDAKTHMSKKDYERTCRRMAHERIKFLHDEEISRNRAKQ